MNLDRWCIHWAKPLSLCILEESGGNGDSEVRSNQPRSTALAQSAGFVCFALSRESPGPHPGCWLWSTIMHSGVTCFQQAAGIVSVLKWMLLSPICSGFTVMKSSRQNYCWVLPWPAFWNRLPSRCFDSIAGGVSKPGFQEAWFSVHPNFLGGQYKSNLRLRWRKRCKRVWLKKGRSVSPFWLKLAVGDTDWKRGGNSQITCQWEYRIRAFPIGS